MHCFNVCMVLKNILGTNMQCDLTPLWSKTHIYKKMIPLNLKDVLFQNISTLENCPSLLQRFFFKMNFQRFSLKSCGIFWPFLSTSFLIVFASWLTKFVDSILFLSSFKDPAKNCSQDNDHNSSFSPYPIECPLLI